MEKKDKIKIGGIAFFVMLLSGLGGMQIDKALQTAIEKDIPIYKCEESNIITNCPYGISGGEHTLCYTQKDQSWWDVNETYSCDSGWQEINKTRALEENNETKPVNPDGFGKKIKCNEKGCVQIK